jgi:hypothetical protein
MKQRLRIASGYSLIAVGVIGIFVPIMPTVPFLLAAAYMLGREHRAIRPWLGYLDKVKIPGRSRAPKDVLQPAAVSVEPPPGTPPDTLRPLGQRE